MSGKLMTYLHTPDSLVLCLILAIMKFSLSILQFGNMEGICTAVMDEFPQLRSNLKHKTLFLALLCFTFYLLGLLLITDVRATNWPIIGFSMCTDVQSLVMYL